MGLRKVRKVMSLVLIFIAFFITQKTELEGRGLELGSQFEGVVVHHGKHGTEAEAKVAGSHLGGSGSSVA